MARSLELELPWPPTVNNYWGHRVVPNKRPRGPRSIVRTFVTHEGQAYRDAVRARFASRPTPIRGRVAVTLLAFPPNRAQRDMDNIQKAVFDALTHCDVWLDDCQIDEIHVHRKPPAPPYGRLSIQIVEIQGAQKELAL
jgi:crossover junction endodeoxyribonuclease RusA